MEFYCAESLREIVEQETGPSSKARDQKAKGRTLGGGGGGDGHKHC